MKKIIPILVVTLALLALGLPAARRALAAPASGTIYTVNSTVDAVDDDLATTSCHTDPLGPAAGACTLRAAVMQANALPGSFSPITISVPAGTYLLNIQPMGSDDGASGDLNLTSELAVINLVGAGAASTIIDANQVDRVLKIAANRTATISGVTLRNGFPHDNNYGGGIANYGALTMDHSVISGNQASGTNSGGGIYNANNLTLTDSTIGPNNSAHIGGGLANAGTLVLDRSTVYGNSADFGAGIYNDSPTNLIVINSTVSQNMAATTGGDGGGIYNDGAANVYNSTIVFNSADTDPNTSSAAGGVRSGIAGAFNIRNTLLAGNYSTNASSASDCTGTVNTYGEDLVGAQDGPGSCTVNLVQGNWTALNSLVLIGPLRDNNGPTLTHALLAGNNGIDAGDSCVDELSNPLATDQRGLPRIVNSVCDIGAFEYSPLNYLFLPLTRR